MMLTNAPVSFKSNLQGLTAMSTVEAEVVASAFAMKEAVFCSNMLTELGSVSYTHLTLPTIYSV